MIKIMDVTRLFTKPPTNNMMIIIAMMIMMVIMAIGHDHIVAYQRPEANQRE